MGIFCLKKKTGNNLNNNHNKVVIGYDVLSLWFYIFFLIRTA